MSDDQHEMFPARPLQGEVLPPGSDRTPSPVVEPALPPFNILGETVAMGLDLGAETIGAVAIFDDGDVVQALKIYEASAGTDPLGAMREVLLFALRVAAINLDVHA